MSDFHASLTPNVASPGDTLTVAFDSSKDADNVVVTLWEVDEASSIDPAATAEKIVSFYGSVKGNKLTLAATPPPTAKANPEPGGAPATAPKITVTVDGASATVGLPGKDKENGVFEILLEVTAKGKAGFKSDVKVFVRDFQYFKVGTTRRPVITFITDADSPGNPFFTNAELYWKAHADAVVVRPGITMEEIVKILKDEQPRYGDWGQVNIVTHGRAMAMKLAVRKGQTPALLDRDTIDAATAASVSFDTAGLDKDSEVVYRACNAGNNQLLLDQIKRDLVGGSAKVQAPKMVQTYSSSPVEEGFMETLTFDVPGTVAPGAAATQTGLQAAFDALPAPHGTWKTEEPSFSENDDWTQTFNFGLTLNEEDTFSGWAKKTPVAKTDAELGDDMKAEWTKQGLEKRDLTWSTLPARWEIKVASKVQGKDQPEGLWVEVTAGTGTPKVIALWPGDLTVGSDPGSDLMIVATGVAANHAMLHNEKGKLTIQGDPSAKTTASAGGKTQTISTTTMTPVSVPCTVTMGGATISVRNMHTTLVSYVISRFWVERRRRLRTFDATKSHADRTLVVPSLKDATHYGSSS
jgi:hypothetical protein